MPRPKESPIFQGKRAEPYTVDEIIEKSGTDETRKPITRGTAYNRLRAAIKDPTKESTLFRPSRTKKYTRNPKSQDPQEKSSNEIKAKLREFDKLTLPSLDALNKYYPPIKR